MEQHKLFVHMMRADLADALTQMALARPQDQHAFLAKFLLERSPHEPSRRMLSVLKQSGVMVGLNPPTATVASASNNEEIVCHDPAPNGLFPGICGYTKDKHGRFRHEFVPGTTPTPTQPQANPPNQSRTTPQPPSGYTPRVASFAGLETQLLGVFQAIDVNDNGVLSFGELQSAFEGKEASYGLPDGFATKFFLDSDVNRDHVLTFREFFDGITGKQALSSPSVDADAQADDQYQESSWTREVAQKVFNDIEKMNDGETTFVELYNHLQNNGEEWSLGLAIEEFEHADVNHDGVLDFEEFWSITTGQAPRISDSLADNMYTIGIAKRLFDQVDTYGDGSLRLHDLKFALDTQLNDNSFDTNVPDFAQQFYDVVEVNGNACIDLQELWSLLNNRSTRNYDVPDNESVDGTDDIVQYSRDADHDASWTREHCDEVFSNMDTGNKGKVKFCVLYRLLRQQETTMDLPSVHTSKFYFCDADDDDFVTADDFWAITCGEASEPAPRPPTPPPTPPAAATHVDPAIRDVDPEIVSQVQALFDSVDVNDNGSISFRELAESLESNNDIELPAGYTERVFELADTNGDDAILFGEFWSYMTRQSDDNLTSTTTADADVDAGASVDADVDASADADADANLDDTVDAENGDLSQSQQQPENLEEKAQYLFEELDPSGEGELSLNEIVDALEADRDQGRFGFPDDVVEKLIEAQEMDDGQMLSCEAFFQLVNENGNLDVTVDADANLDDTVDAADIRDVDPEIVSQVQALFDSVDVNDNGSISFRELAESLESNNDIELPAGYTERVFELADTNGDDAISFGEFWSYMTRQSDDNLTSTATADADVDAGESIDLDAEEEEEEAKEPEPEPEPVNEDLEELKSIKALLGCKLLRLSGDEGEEGVGVDKVNPKGAAAQAFLISGDVIKEINGEVMSAPENVMAAIKSKLAGDIVNITLQRTVDGRAEIVPVELFGKGASQDDIRDLRIKAGLEVGETEMFDDEKARFALLKMKPMVGFKIIDSGGVTVSGVPNSGPAFRAGVQVQDKVLAVEEKMLKDNKQFVRELKTFRTGDRIRLKINRKKQTQTLVLELGAKGDNSVEKVRSLRLIAGIRDDIWVDEDSEMDL